ncbi:MAG: hypothetical protein ACXQTI_06215 [Candidatus Nezhaarchaeales archaeon]
MPRTSPPRKIPIIPDDPSASIKAFSYPQDVEDEEVEELLQSLTSNQGIETIIGVIDSLISTIEYQEIMIWSLAKLLEEKGLITKDEFLKKIEEVNKKKLAYSDME